MTPLQQEARRWLGGAVLIAVLIAIALALALPRLDLLAMRYSVL